MYINIFSFCSYYSENLTIKNSIIAVGAVVLFYIFQSILTEYEETPKDITRILIYLNIVAMVSFSAGMLATIILIYKLIPGVT